MDKIFIPIVLSVVAGIISHIIIRKAPGLMDSPEFKRWSIIPTLYFVLMIWAFYVALFAQVNFVLQVIIAGITIGAGIGLFYFLNRKSELEEDCDLIRKINRTNYLVLSTSLIPIDRWLEKGYLYLLNYQTSISISKFVNQLDRDNFAYCEGEHGEKEAFEASGAFKLSKVLKALEMRDLSILSDDHYSFRFFIYNEKMFESKRHMHIFRKIYYLHHFNAIHCIFLRRESIEVLNTTNHQLHSVCETIDANPTLKRRNVTNSVIPDIMLLDLETVYFENRHKRPESTARNNVVEVIRSFFVELIKMTIRENVETGQIEFTEHYKNLWGQRFLADLPLIPKKKG